ncbi:MAG TPA: hypothetical protein VNE39_22290 [Planctomycetota bacterium]|nr:hypothetical protein [Planctomycetota bacterium]
MSPTARKATVAPATTPSPRDAAPPEQADTERIQSLASMSDEDLGTSEEDVKIRFVVPLLEALGHSRMRFEHAQTDIVLADGLPRGSHVVVETKRPDINLDLHLARLHMYAIAERSLLALLTNGCQLRIYAPFWNHAPSFAETLLWEFERADLTREHHVNSLVSVLSRNALATGWARAAMLQQQSVIEATWAAAEKVRQQFRQQRTDIEERLLEIERLHTELDAERDRLLDDTRHLAPREREKLRRLFRTRAVPIIPTSDFGFLLSSSPVVPRPRSSSLAGARRTPAARESSPPVLRRWTRLDLHARATPKQKRVFAAFVRLGRRTADASELARRTDLSAESIPSVLAKFIGGAAKLDREPLMQVEIRGRVKGEGRSYSILPRYWPLIRRLYAKAAR